MQLSTQTRTCMLDNSPIQATFHAPSRTFDQIMSSVCCCYCCFCFCLIRNFLFFFTIISSEIFVNLSLNSTECFCVPWSWTDHLPRRKASPVASASVYRMSLLFAPLRSIRKLFLFTGCLCYSSSSDAEFLDGCVLLDADRGNLSLPLRRERLQH